METIGYILFIFIMGAAGPASHVQPFDTMKACQEERADLTSRVATANSKQDGPRIDFIAMSCAPIVKAPQGLGV